MWKRQIRGKGTCSRSTYAPVGTDVFGHDHRILIQFESVIMMWALLLAVNGCGTPPKAQHHIIWRSDLPGCDSRSLNSQQTDTLLHNLATRTKALQCIDGCCDPASQRRLCISFNGFLRGIDKCCETVRWSLTSILCYALGYKTGLLGSTLSL